MTYNNIAAFSCLAQASADQLKITYAIRNLTASNLGIFNRIPSVNASGFAMFLPETVYADMEEQTLHLKKMVLPVPPGLKMSARPIPNVTRLRPGEDVGESFALNLPLQVYNPLKRAEMAGSAPSYDIAAASPVWAFSLRLSIGIFVAPPDLEFIPVSQDLPGTFRVWPPGPAVDRQVILSERPALVSAIAVLDYAGIPRQA